MSAQPSRGQVLGVRATVAGLCALCVLVTAELAAAQDRQQNLDALRGEIDASRERVGGHERDERKLLEEVEDLDKSLASLAVRVSQARKREKASRSEAVRLEKDGARLATRLGGTRAALRSRARALYKAGEIGPLRALFAAESLADFLQRISTLRRLVGYDRDLVVRIQDQHARLSEAQALAIAARAQHAEAARELEQSLRSLGAKRSERKKLLASVHTSRTRERSVLVELERAARALETTIETLGAELSGGVGEAAFEALRGKLAWPVKAKIGRGFGRVVDGEFHTATFNKGVEFLAKAGTPVVAAEAGEVRFAGWFRGYGRIVILDHGGGYFTVSGHLEDLTVKAGAPVKAGDTIGTVGETGSLNGPKLYFEVRKGSTPLDPEKWLAKS